MSTAEEQNRSTAEDAADSIEIPVDELVAAVWQRRRWLAMLTGIGLILAVVIALLIPNEYTSTAQLMPPDQQALSSPSLLSALTGAGAVARLGGGLMSARSPGGTFIGMLNSQTEQDEIINRLGLQQVYHCKFLVDARKILAARTVIDEDKNSGIIRISVTDRNPARARDIAKAYVEELNKLVNSLSTSSASREREFLEQRLASLKSNLDATSLKLSQFSSRNATINPQSQGQALITNASRLQSELITAQSDLSGLKEIYSDGNVRVREAQARIDELQSQLRKMGKAGGKSDGSNQQSNQLYPSIRELPLLGVTYADLSRQLAMQEGIYETLDKQYELARVEEAKEIPTVKVLDEPQVPERKSSPHRSIIVLLGILIAAFAGIAWIVAVELWKMRQKVSSSRVV